MRRKGGDRKYGTPDKGPGGTVYNNWNNAAMALYHLDGLEDRLKQTVVQAQDPFTAE